MSNQGNNLNEPYQDLSAYHQSLLEQHANGLNTVEPSAADLKLIAFNGYYSLKMGEGAGTPGAFLTIDTNLVIHNGNPKPNHYLTVILSTDGVHSKRYPFPSEGSSFVNNTLTLAIPSANSENTILTITFQHVDEATAITSTFTGTYEEPGIAPISVSGITYNNPIPIHMYNGLYHEKRDLIMGTEKKQVMTNVMQIGPNNELHYDYGDNSGLLQAVPIYAYNLNMYYFSIQKGKTASKVIMGTSSGGGLVCNNISVTTNNNTNKTIARSLQTITSTTNDLDFNPSNSNAEQLAQFAGYYQLKSSLMNTVSETAFLSIEGIYTVSGAGEAPIYKIKIGLSLDGKHARVIPFDDKMTFDTNTLTIPNELEKGKPFAVIQFNRTYQADGNYGVLVGVNMTMGDNNITGTNRLNPVPLDAFGGAPMTNVNGDSLVIKSNAEVVYNGIQMRNIIYVPLMYILAYNFMPVGDKPNPNSYAYSFGTDGVRGNCCIVTHKGIISSVYAVAVKNT